MRAAVSLMSLVIEGVAVLSYVTKHCAEVIRVFR